MIAGLMLELGNQLGINVVAPVIDRQGFIAAIVCFWFSSLLHPNSAPHSSRMPMAKLSSFSLDITFFNRYDLIFAAAAMLADKVVADYQRQ